MMFLAFPIVFIAGINLISADEIAPKQTERFLAKIGGIYPCRNGDENPKEPKLFLKTNKEGNELIISNPQPLYNIAILNFYYKLCKKLEDFSTCQSTYTQTVDYPTCYALPPGQNLVWYLIRNNTKRPDPKDHEHHGCFLDKGEYSAKITGAGAWDLLLAYPWHNTGNWSHTIKGIASDDLTGTVLFCWDVGLVVTDTSNVSHSKKLIPKKHYG